MHNLFLVYFVNLYMFLAYLGPSSGGTTICIQHLVLSILFRWLSSWLGSSNPTRTTDSHLKRIISTSCCIHMVVEHIWNVMAHAQKPDLVFQRNGQVHLNWWGRQFSRLLVAEVCASAVVMIVMLDTPCSQVECRTTGYPLHSHVSPSLPLPCVTVCHQVSTELYLLMMGLDMPETCTGWRNILRISCASSWFFFTCIPRCTVNKT